MEPFMIRFTTQPLYNRWTILKAFLLNTMNDLFFKELNKHDASL
jgi:hypothetical protein